MDYYIGYWARIENILYTVKRTANYSLPFEDLRIRLALWLQDPAAMPPVHEHTSWQWMFPDQSALLPLPRVSNR